MRPVSGVWNDLTYHEFKHIGLDIRRMILYDGRSIVIPLHSLSFEEMHMRRLLIALCLVTGMWSLSAAEASYGFGIGPQFGFPNATGTFNDHVSWGGGVRSHLRFHITERASIYGVTGYVSWNKGTRVPVTGDTVSVRDYDCIPVMIGAQYYLRGSQDLRFYVCAEAGLRFFSINAKQVDGESTLVSQNSYSETKGSFAPGVGLTYRMGNYSYIDACARIEYVSSGLSYMSISITIGYREYDEY